MREMKWFWPVGLVAVMAVGLWLFLTGYDAGLPLYESKDERHNLDEIYTLRGLHDDELWKPGYPPGILYVNYSAQLLTEIVTGDSAWDRACTVIRMVRLDGIIANMLTALLVALAARKLAGDGAGLLAALAWLVAPRVLGQAQFGFPQVYENFFYMLALYTAILSVEKQKRRYALLSVLAGLGAVIFKYSNFPGLALGVGAALWHLRDSGQRRRWFPLLAVQFVLIALAAAGLFLFGGIGSLADAGHVETNRFFDSGLSGLLNFDIMAFIFTNAAGQIGLGVGVFLALLIVGSVAFWPRANTWQRLGWAGVVGLALGHLVFMTTYLVELGGIDRYILSSSGLMAVIAGVAVAATGREIGRRAGRPALAYALVALFAAVWLAPQFVKSVVWVQYRSLPVTYGDLLVWADQVLPEEAMLVNDWRPFTREWSCYLRTERNAIQFEELTDRTIDEWLARDVYYAQLTQSEIDTLAASPQGQAYLDRMTLLRRFPPEGEEDQWRTWRRGFETEFAVYRLWSFAPDVAVDTVLADMIRLAGYDINSATVPAGEALEMFLYWQPVQPPDGDYSVFVHLTPEDAASPVLAQADGVPSRSNFRSTVTWTDMDETFISRPFVIDIPADTAPGTYTLRFGLYDWQTGQRLLTDSGDDHVAITITVL